MIYLCYDLKVTVMRKSFFINIHRLSLISTVIQRRPLFYNNLKGTPRFPQKNILVPTQFLSGICLYSGSEA